MSARTKMRATLVRFGPDLYEDLKAAAERSEVSIAQYVRESVLARIAYDAGRRGDPDWDTFDASPTTMARRARDKARRTRQESGAVKAQAEQVRRKIGDR